MAGKVPGKNKPAVSAIEPEDLAYVNTYVNGQPACFLLDNGSSFSMISRNTYNRIPQKYRPTLRRASHDPAMADGDARMKVIGEITAPFRVFDEEFDYNLLVVEQKVIDGIWGMDFQKRFDYTLEIKPIL